MQRRKSKRLKRTILVTFVCLIAVGAYWFLTLTNEPSEGVLKAANTSISSDVQGEAGLASISGEYITFDYPADFIETPVAKPGGTQLETFKFVKKPAPFAHLAIQVSSLPSGQMSDDGSYNFRATTPARFKSEIWSIDSQPVQIFTDTSIGYGKVAFSSHSGKLLTVALSSDDTTDQEALQEVLMGVLSSLEWVE